MVSLQTGLEAQGQQATDQPSPAPGARKEVPKGGAIRGKVIGADTGDGLKKVTLVLRATQAQGGDQPASTQTDADGEYRFEDVKPGKYSLSARRNGYVDSIYGQKSVNLYSQTGGITLDVRAGDSLNSINFKMIRGGAVEGRIVDSDNEPVARAFVQAARYASLQGKRRLVPAGMAFTDDRGHFRLFNIPPGLYYLRAAYRTIDMPETGLGSALTYYPGVATPQEASKIQVRAGRELTGMDITLSEAEAFSVSGRAIGPDGKPFPNAYIHVVQFPYGEIITGNNWAQSNVGGEFRLKGLFPGKYLITAGAERDEKRLDSSLIVEITNNNIEGVMLTLGEGTEVSGRVQSEGQKGSLEFLRLRVSLDANIDNPSGFFARGGEVKEDATFRLTGIPEMIGTFKVTGLRGNYFLQSVRVDGREVTDTPIEIKGNNPLEGVEIIISAQGASLNGIVKLEEQGPPVKGATVLVFPVALERRGTDSRFVKTSQSDQQGHYSIQGLPPGEYFISALKSLEGGLESDEAFLKELQKTSTRVRLELGEAREEPLIAQETPEFE